MHFTPLFALAAVTSLAASAAHPSILDTRETCSTPSGSGTCQSTSSCATFSVSGFCSGGTSNQCCVSKSCSTSSGSGTCKSTSKGCSGGSFVSGACPGDSSVQCCVTGGSSGGNLPGLNAKQSGYARTIIGVVKSRGLGRQGCLAGIATAYTETDLRNLANNAVPESLNYPNDGLGADHDSIGLFQQRPSLPEYSNVAADMDPARSAGQFFDKVVKVSGWQTMDIGELCQKVQKSAPNKYNDKGVPVAKPVCDASGF